MRRGRLGGIMRKWALRALGTIETLSARMASGEAIEKTPFTWSGVRDGIVMSAIGAGLGLLWYEEWLPKGLLDSLVFLVIVILFTALGLGSALVSYLSLRAERLGTARAGMHALAALIALSILGGAMIVGVVAGAIWAIGGLYYLIGSETIRWVTGDVEGFPSEIISWVAMMLAIPLAFHIRDVYSWIGWTKNAGLIFALIALVAPFTALQVASTLHLLWRFVHLRLIEEETPVVIWIIGIILNGLDVLVATLLILFIVRAVRRLGALKTAQPPINRQNGG